MDKDQKKRILSASDIEKKLNQLIKAAIDILTQIVPSEASGCFCKKAVQLRPDQLIQFQYDAIYNIIRQKMPLTPDCIIKLCDSFITTYPDAVFLNFMDYAVLRNVADYKAEQFDCDDFSITFAALARKWHARIRAQLEEKAHLKASLPAPAPEPAEVRIVPHMPNAKPDVRCVGEPAAAAPATPSTSTILPAAEDTKYLGGAPVGICHGRLAANYGEHAFNFWINSKGDVIFIEPQTGEYITLGSGAQIDFVLI